MRIKFYETKEGWPEDYYYDVFVDDEPFDDLREFFQKIETNKKTIESIKEIDSDEAFELRHKWNNKR